MVLPRASKADSTSAITALTKWREREGHASITWRNSGGSVIRCPEASPDADGPQPVSSQKHADLA